MEQFQLEAKKLGLHLSRQKTKVQNLGSGVQELDVIWYIWQHDRRMAEFRSGTRAAYSRQLEHAVRTRTDMSEWRPRVCNP